jgi:hypothetical protein
MDTTLSTIAENQPRNNSLNEKINYISLIREYSLVKKSDSLFMVMRDGIHPAYRIPFNTGIVHMKNKSVRLTFKSDNYLPMSIISDYLIDQTLMKGKRFTSNNFIARLQLETVSFKHKVLSLESFLSKVEIMKKLFSSNSIIYYMGHLSIQLQSISLIDGYIVPIYICNVLSIEDTSIYQQDV